MEITEKLRAFGANVDEGISRCLDDEDFYIDLVRSVVPDTRLDDLESCLAAKDLDKAFEVAHALKGMYGNIAITPVFEPVNEMTELLRARKDVDYSALIEKAKAKKKELDKILM